MSAHPSAQAFSVALLLAAGLLVGCQAANKPADPDNKRAVLIEIPTEQVYSQKDEYISQMKKDLSERQTELEALAQRVDNSTGSSKVDAAVKLEEVRSKMATTRIKLDYAEKSNEEQWAETKKSFKDSYEDMKQTLSDTQKWIKDKIDS